MNANVSFFLIQSKPYATRNLISPSYNALNILSDSMCLYLLGASSNHSDDSTFIYTIQE